MYFENLLRCYTTDSIEPGGNQSVVSAGVKKEVQVKNGPESLDPECRYVGDIAALCKEYGHLESGQIISISLQDLQRICPRDRVRVEAYQGLVNWLGSEIRVTLNIYSNKTKGKQNLPNSESGSDNNKCNL